MSKLTQERIDVIKMIHEKESSVKEAQAKLSSLFNVSERTVRRWFKEIGLSGEVKIVNSSKVLVYDIETSRATAKVFWTGKQYVGYKQIVKQPSIISISFKWIGEDTVHDLVWDKNHNDKKMVKEFLKHYNKADMVIGFNNDNFDNRWINAVAMKNDLHVNTFVKSMDLYKQEKRLFRLLSYSMDFSSLFAKVERKQSHEGMLMWDMVEDGTPEQQKEYLRKMVNYNVGDIITTEELYIRLLPYLKHKIHFGVLNGEEKWTCPNTGSKEVSLYKRTCTPAGTIQIIMQSSDESLYKISNKSYIDYLTYKTTNNEQE